MSDEQTTRTEAEKTSGTAKTVPPTPPVASEAATGATTTPPTTSATSTGASTTPSTTPSTGASTSGATAAPAGPGEDVNSGDRPPVDSVGATPGSPFDKAVDAATEAAKKATARLKEAADNADLDHFADEAKRVTGTWSEKVKAEYERRPGVVIGAAVAGAVVLGLIARGLGRRR